MRGVTSLCNAQFLVFPISTHTPHARRDQTGDGGSGALCAISTHTPHARRDSLFSLLRSRKNISTHTPHARRDGENLTQEITLANFNSHASCEA